MKAFSPMAEEHRQALLRFAEFESKRMETADDSALMMMQLALFKLFERDPKRVARIFAVAIAVYGDNAKRPPWVPDS
jgi:hypothetical protein